MKYQDAVSIAYHLRLNPKTRGAWATLLGSTDDFWVVDLVTHMGDHHQFLDDWFIGAAVSSPIDPSDLDTLERIANEAAPRSWDPSPVWLDEMGFNNGGVPTRFFHIPQHNGGAKVEMIAEVSLHIVAFQPRTALKLISAVRVTQEHLAQAWDDGLDFAGDALRGGASLTEAATANPYRRRPPV